MKVKRSGARAAMVRCTYNGSTIQAYTEINNVQHELHGNNEQGRQEEITYIDSKHILMGAVHCNNSVKQVSHHSQRMGGVNAVALSQDETTVLTMGQEKRITYWDLREHHPVLAKAREVIKRGAVEIFRTVRFPVRALQPQ